VSWQHSNLLGEYDFSDEKLRDSVGISPKKLVLEVATLSQAESHDNFAIEVPGQASAIFLSPRLIASATPSRSRQRR
jgi:hypothetical protein